MVQTFHIYGHLKVYQTKYIQLISPLETLECKNQNVKMKLVNFHDVIAITVNSTIICLEKMVLARSMMSITIYILLDYIRKKLETLFIQFTVTLSSAFRFIMHLII